MCRQRHHPCWTGYLPGSFLPAGIQRGLRAWSPRERCRALIGSPTIRACRRDRPQPRAKMLPTSLPPCSPLRPSSTLPSACLLPAETMLQQNSRLHPEEHPPHHSRYPHHKSVQAVPGSHQAWNLKPCWSCLEPDINADQILQKVVRVPNCQGLASGPRALGLRNQISRHHVRNQGRVYRVVEMPSSVLQVMGGAGMASGLPFPPPSRPAGPKRKGQSAPFHQPTATHHILDARSARSASADLSLKSITTQAPGMGWADGYGHLPSLLRVT